MPKYFTAKTFAFLRELAKNNDRDWFKSNQAKFEEHVRGPALEFIEDFGAPLNRVSKSFVADPRKVGGSLFRIQRDIRFSKDKSPYKTHVGIHFRHEATRKDVHAPGFYLHLEPQGCFAALGLWHPATPNANAIREAITADPGRWKRAVHGKRFVEVYGALEGESLKRPPRGFDPEHPLLEDLKRKDFIASTRLTQKQVTSDDFQSTYLATLKAGVPFMRFLCQATGQEF